MAKQTSHRWKDLTDPLNIKLLSYITYRTEDGLPILPAYHGEIPKTLIPFHLEAGQKKIKTEHFEGFAHFYLDDYQFERVWNYPLRYVEYLKRFDGVLSPDFSVYENYYPRDQKENIYRNRALGAFWLSQGIAVIPSISWNNEKSYNWCFEGVEPGGIVSISTVGSLRTEKGKYSLLFGYSEMINRLKPSTVIIYGRYPKELDNFGVINIRMRSYSEKFEEDRDISIESL